MAYDISEAFNIVRQAALLPCYGIPFKLLIFPVISLTDDREWVFTLFLYNQFRCSKGTVLTLVPLLLNINNLLSLIYNSVHSSRDDNTLRSNFPILY